MSTVASRPKVQSVSCALVAAGATVTVALATQMARQFLSMAGRRVFEQQLSSLPNASFNFVQPVAALRQEFHQQQQKSLSMASKSLPPVEALRVATLLGMAAVPFQARDAYAIRQSWSEFEKTRDISHAHKLQTELVKSLESNHQGVFMNSLALACRNAALKIGFDRIETTQGVNGETRVIASDPSGRTLVNEIHAEKQGHIGLKTEVVNVMDDSCAKIQDDFDQALTKEGVRASKPDRKFTGGVCELAAAREFVRRKIRRSISVCGPEIGLQTGKESRRAQQLNSSHLQSQRQRN